MVTRCVHTGAEIARRVIAQLEPRAAFVDRAVVLVPNEQPFIDLRVAHFHQRAAADRRGPFQLCRVVVRFAWITVTRRTDRLTSGCKLTLLPLPDTIEIRTDLVPLGRLRGQTEKGTPDMLFSNGRHHRRNRRMVTLTSGQTGFASDGATTVEVILNLRRGCRRFNRRLERPRENLVNRDRPD